MHLFGYPALKFTTKICAKLSCIYIVLASTVAYRIYKQIIRIEART